MTAGAGFSEQNFLISQILFYCNIIKHFKQKFFETESAPFLLSAGRVIVGYIMRAPSHVSFDLNEN